MISTRHVFIRSNIINASLRCVGATFLPSSQFTAANITNNNCHSYNNNNNNQQQQQRYLASKPSIGSDPLDILRKECVARKKCDEHGQRLVDTQHWALSIAVSASDPTLPPNLRTISIERINSDGIDFVMKRTSAPSLCIQSGAPVAILYQEGKFLPGQSAEQWRGEGYCTTIPLQDIVPLIPIFTLTSIVASRRIAMEATKASSSSSNDTTVSDGRLAMMNKSRTTEVMQRTRNELEAGIVPMNEMEDSIIAFRFQPNRLEHMHGSPDSVMWDRWEWIRDKETNTWIDPQHLIPH